MKECPRCKESLLEDEEVLNCISRRDNRTQICVPCGREEAMFDHKISQQFHEGLLSELDYTHLRVKEQMWLRRSG